MSRIFTATLLAASLAASGAMADGVTLGAPLAGATLHAPNVDMSLYFKERGAETAEVVATYVSADAPDAPRSFTVVLAEGDAANFTLRESPDTLYRFERTGNEVVATHGPAELAME